MLTASPGGENPLQFLISRIEDIGRCREKLSIIINDDIFETLSKHNPFWESVYEKEGEKLEELRFKFRQLQDSLLSLQNILENQHDD